MFPMSAPTPAANALKSRLWIRRRRKAEDPETWNLTLVSAGTSLPFRLAAESPTLLMAAVEDLCWCLAVEELEARRPRRWHRRALAGWREERARLEEKRVRIAEMTADAVSEL